jgi:hypothetical protein
MAHFFTPLANFTHMRYINSYGRILLILFTSLLLTAGAFAQQIPDSVIKKNISGIQDPLQSLIRLEPKVFEYNKDKYKDLRLPAGRQYGFLTDEVQNIYPELIGYKHFSYMIGKNVYRTARVKTLDTESLIPILVASIKQQQLEIEKLKTEIQALKQPATAADR